MAALWRGRQARVFCTQGQRQRAGRPRASALGVYQAPRRLRPLQAKSIGFVVFIFLKNSVFSKKKSLCAAFALFVSFGVPALP